MLSVNPLSRIVSVGVVAAALAGCAAKVQPVACPNLQVGDAESAIVMLVDRASPSFIRVLDRVVDDPESAFTVKALGLASDPGIVVLATFDGRGEVVEHGAFNLLGVANSDARRRVNAKNQAQCLKDAVVALPPEGTGGDLIRSLPAAAAIGRSYASRRVGIVAFGLGRSGGDGFQVATTDFGDSESRTYVLDELARFGLLPNLSGRNISLLLVAPSEGVPTGISAAGITAFAKDLCGRLGATPCTSDEVLF